MIPEILGWTTFVVTLVVAALVCYVLYQTGRHPTAWANRIVPPVLPDYDFKVSGDDTTGFF